MHRFFIAREIINYFDISDIEQLHYMKNVLRLKIGDEITAIDNSGNEFISVIEATEKDRFCLVVKEKLPTRTSTTHLTIACAIPKKDDMDEIIDKLTQLQADSIIPMETDRTIVKLDERKKEIRLERWRKIALNAAQQSQRDNIPLIQQVTGFKQIITQSHEYQLKLIPTLNNETRDIREVISYYNQGDIIVLIGPEGDFTPQEVKLAIDQGFTPISLGTAVLRVSTAAIAIASYLKMALAI